METFNTSQAAHVLGCPPKQARRILEDQPATPVHVEQLALDRYHWKAHVDDPRSHGSLSSRLARILHLSRQRVKQLLEADRLPYEVGRSGVRLMRRRQLETG